MMKPFLAVLIVALAVPAVAYAAGEGKKKEPKICKTVVRTGSNLGERLCLTVDQWVSRAERDQEKENLAQIHRERQSASGTMGGIH
jgi:hypothetical protein